MSKQLWENVFNTKVEKMCTVQQPSGTQRVVLSMESHTLHVKLGSFGPNLHAHWTHSVSCHEVQFDRGSYFYYLREIVEGWVHQMLIRGGGRWLIVVWHYFILSSKVVWHLVTLFTDFPKKWCGTCPWATPLPSPLNSTSFTMLPCRIGKEDWILFPLIEFMTSICNCESYHGWKVLLILYCM